MRKLSVMVALLLFAPLAALSGGAPSFEGGAGEAVASLVAPGFEATVNLVVPADYYVTNATMKVTGMAAEGNTSAYPENVSVRLKDTILWMFQGTGYGNLGMQNQFSTGLNEVKCSFGSDGGSQKASIRLPKDAVVQSATMETAGSPQGSLDLVNFTGAIVQGVFGQSVSDAGDVNNDGWDDVIVGAPLSVMSAPGPGYAFIYYGGTGMDNTADVVLTGAANYDCFGSSVSGAGDVNKDGYDDVIVGARYNCAGGHNAGRAYIYFGGANMDSTADVILTGVAQDDGLGYSVSCSGDVNKDGYDDVVVGAVWNDSAYIYYGGAGMDRTADVILTGAAAGESFGCSVSGAGDVNNDGYDDVVVGADRNDAGGNDAGRAYVYYGGASMDSTADVTFYGAAADDWLGDSVSCAGDVNKDGYDDVVVGACDSTDLRTDGKAYVYYGGVDMDNTSDINLLGDGTKDKFGFSVSNAGDVNKDGYGDVIVGARTGKVNGSSVGLAYIYYGGASMNSTSDVVLAGAANSDYFGCSVSSAGDVNKDGYDEMFVGASLNDSGGANTGRAYIYSIKMETLIGILDPRISIGKSAIWSANGYFNGTAETGDFATVLNDCLRSASASGHDSFGNDFVDLELNLSAKCAGTLALFNLNIYYQYNASIPNFAPSLNDYLSFHQNKKDASGNIIIPITIRSGSAGRVKLSSLALTRDLAPKLVEEIKSMEIDEDMADYNFANIHQFFQDDVDPVNNLSFSVASSTNSTYVTVGIRNNRYLTVDAMTGDANDNWTGTVEVVVACSDHWVQRTESNQFTIVVKNVNDPPIITSTPILVAEPGIPYHYNVTVFDPDKDTIQYYFTQAPSNMTVDASNGTIKWRPRPRGIYEVILVVNDGNETAEQDFFITVLNRPPIITSSPTLKAYVGIPYTYNITAEDPNLDALSFSLLGAPNGMDLEHSSNALVWTPDAPGNFDVSIKAWDGKIGTFQNFSVEVVQGNRAPEFKTKPVTVATVDSSYIYNASATDPDKDVLEFSIESCPEGMTVDNAKGQVSWKPKSIGNFTVVLKVSDGKGGEATQEFIIKVLPAVRPKVVLEAPEPGKTLKGIVIFSGTVTKGTREVVQAQMRVDGGEWKDAVGTDSWTFTINTKSLKKGVHAFEFRAYDGTEYSDIVKLDFKVDNTVGGGKGFIPMLDGMTVLALAMTIGLILWRRGKQSTVKGD